jgi:hypothetical protein
MENVLIQLNEFPDEILLLIFKKLHTSEVLYSFIGVNKRLNKLVHDSIFTNRLMMIRPFSDRFFQPLDDRILDRFCSQILPEIHHKIKWFNVELSSMKRILLSASYPNLYGLGLYDIDEESIVRNLNSKKFPFDL